MTELLLGDEAVGLAAIDAGIGGVFSYPGTPATEVFEFVEVRTVGLDGVSAGWSANEKVAYEAALGMSFAGKRALVAMKHVGLNVAADPFMNSALTGAHGGLVCVVADDPGMHSSQNEQDSRYYGEFAQVPVFEPSSQQEAYDMTREAFELSERIQIPVLVRLVTRLSHTRADVRPAEPKKLARIGRSTDWRQWTLLPVNARVRYRKLLDLQPTLREYAETTPFNKLTLRGPTGVIASGLGYAYAREAVGDLPYSMLKVSVYPTPRELVRRLVDHCEQIVVIEEGYAFIEKQLNGLLGVPGKTIVGRSTGDVPRCGELNADLVRKALGLKCASELSGAVLGEALPPRPPRLCDGCPHCDTFRAMMEALEGSEPYLFGDIGCYTLSALPPYGAMQTCVDMGASIGMAVGAARAGVHPVTASIGDSTLIHSGMTPLIEAAREDLNMTVFILDNGTVAMTGGQHVFVTGEDLLDVVRGLGVRHERIVRLDPRPQKHERNVELVRGAIEQRGLSVVVACRPCIHAKRKLVRSGKEAKPAAV